MTAGVLAIIFLATIAAFLAIIAVILVSVGYHVGSLT
jgi:hypothetical protein